MAGWMDLMSGAPWKGRIIGRQGNEGKKGK